MYLPVSWKPKHKISGLGTPWSTNAQLEHPEGTTHWSATLPSDQPSPLHTSCHSIPIRGPLFSMHDTGQGLHTLFSARHNNHNIHEKQALGLSGPAFQMATSTHSLAVINKTVRVVVSRLHSTHCLIDHYGMGLGSRGPVSIGKNATLTSYL